MNFKIAFFDIDGTLVNEEKVIPQDTLDSIAEIKALGVEPVIATGRAPYFVKPLLEELGIESYVCLNGAYAVYKGETIYRNPINKGLIQKLVELAEINEHAITFEGDEHYFASSENHSFVYESVASLKVTQPGVDADFWKKAEIYQMFLHLLDGEESKYESILNELHFIRWHPLAVDVLPIGGSKAQGIEEVLKLLGLSKEQAIAFGDGLNDKEMLEYVGFGVAMGNSHPDLIPYSDFVSTDVDHQGIRNGLIEAGILPKVEKVF